MTAMRQLSVCCIRGKEKTAGPENVVISIIRWAVQADVRKAAVRIEEESERTSTTTKNFLVCLFTMFLFCRGVCIQQQENGRIVIYPFISFSQSICDTHRTQTADKCTNHGSRNRDNIFKKETGVNKREMKKNIQ